MSEPTKLYAQLVEAAAERERQPILLGEYTDQAEAERALDEHYAKWRTLMRAVVDWIEPQHFTVKLLSGSVQHFWLEQPEPEHAPSDWDDGSVWLFGDPTP